MAGITPATVSYMWHLIGRLFLYASAINGKKLVKVCIFQIREGELVAPTIKHSLHFFLACLMVGTTNPPPPDLS